MSDLPEHYKLMYPSKYLRGVDFIGGKSARVTISKVDPFHELIGEKGRKDVKPVLYFQGKKKGLILNKTNADSIGKMHGSRIENWVGKQITLYGVDVPLQGKMVPGIRVKK